VAGAGAWSRASSGTRCRLARQHALEAPLVRTGHLHVYRRVGRPPLAARPPPEDAGRAQELVPGHEIADRVNIGAESALQAIIARIAWSLAGISPAVKPSPSLCQPRLACELVSIALLGDLAQSFGVTGRIDHLECLVRGHGHVEALALAGHGTDAEHVDGTHGNVGPGGFW
jgi:hypothetical protein